jgi:hypothetical protein
MEDPSLQTCLTVIITIFSILGVMLIAKSRRWWWFGRRDKQMLKLGQKLNIPVTGGTPGKEAKIDGEDAEGNHIRVYHHVEAYATTTQTILSTEIEIENPADISFSIALKSKAGAMANILGHKPLKTGDSNFDESFVVKSKTAEITNEILTAEIRELCHIAWDEKGAHGLMKLKGNILLYNESTSLFSDAQVRRIEAIVKLSKAIKHSLENLTSFQSEA